MPDLDRSRPRVSVSLLGEVVVRLEREPVGPAGVKRRGLLARLALAANHPVTVDELVEGLWADDPPRSAANVVQTYVSTWRRALEVPPARGRTVGAASRARPGADGQRLRTLGSAYELVLADDECDLLQLDGLAFAAAGAVATGRFEHAAAGYAEALALFRGPPLADVRSVPFAAEASATLQQRRAALVEQWAYACLLGRVSDPQDVATALEQLGTSEPLRERAVELQMWALCRSGQPARALHVYERTRRMLAAELGADPGAGLRTMHADVLADADRLRPTLAAAAIDVAAIDIAAIDVAAIGVAAIGAAQLRRRGDTFLGRDRELADITALLSTHRLVTLVGPGGAGKTRLAEEVVMAQAGSVAFVELAGLDDTGLVPGAISDALGLALAAQDPLAGLVERLVETDTLLVLDNLEHLAGVAAVVDRVVRGTRRLRILATSRQPLGVAAEQRYAVGALAVPDPDENDPARVQTAASVQLLVDRARAVDPHFAVTQSTAAALAGIVTALDGLPLAIEIAASWVNVLSAEQLQSRLRDLYTVDRQNRQTSDRHRTLDAVVGWSFRLLSTEQQRLLARLRVFRGSAPLPAIEAVCGHDLLHPALAVLGDLVDRSLVVPVPGGPTPRFRLLETVRQYLDRRFANDDEGDDIVRRHVAYYATWTAGFAAHTEGADAGPWFQEATADLHNVRLALDASIGSSDELQLVANCAGFWHELGHLREGVDRLERALATAAIDDSARPFATAQHAWLMLSVDLNAAAGLAARAVELAELAEDLPVLALAYQVAGYAVPATATAEAIATLQAAIDTARESRGRSVRYACTSPAAVRVGATNGLLLRYAFRDVSTAIAMCEDELRRAELDHDLFARHQFTTQLRLALLRSGRVDAAARLPRVNTGPLTAGGAFNAAVADGIKAFYGGDADEAAQSFLSARSMATQRGSLVGLAIATGWVVDLHVDTGAIGNAAKLLADTETRCRHADSETHAMVWSRTARLARRAGDLRLAQESLDRAGHAGIDDQLTPEAIVWLIESAATASALGDSRAAAAHLDVLRSRSRQTGIVVPPWEQRRINEFTNRDRLHGLHAV